jgi:hypothetical protein
LAKTQKIFSYVELDDSTPIQRLSIIDQIRVLLKHLARDDSAELDNANAVTVAEMQLRANLLSFLDKALDKIREGSHKSVTVDLSSKFEPVLESVLATPAIATFYSYKITRPDIDYGIDYFVRVRLEVKP